MADEICRLVNDTSGEGMAATAPCGHPGVHLTRNYVQCQQGCEKRVRRGTTCLHRGGVVSGFNVTEYETRCIECRALVRYDYGRNEWRAA